MNRIVYTLAIGKPKFAQCALGLGRSLKLIGDSTKRVVVTDQSSFPWSRTFDEVLPSQDPIEWIFFTKLTALDRTDADQVLFVDGDSLAFKRLDPIFEYCEGRGFAVQGRPISSGQWYGDVAEHCVRHGVSTLPNFNGGLIYYERTPETKKFIETVMEYGRKSRELGFWRDDPLIPDEPCISLAMAKTGFGHLIPDEMDFSNSATGLVGKLDMDVARGRCAFVCRSYQVRYMEPYIFHASRYINFLVYWRQLAVLERLEKYEQKHEYGHMSGLQKLERSIQRRYLKYIARKF